jgi:hypothetical protein
VSWGGRGDHWDSIREEEGDDTRHADISMPWVPHTCTFNLLVGNSNSYVSNDGESVNFSKSVRYSKYVLCAKLRTVIEMWLSLKFEVKVRWGFILGAAAG